MKHRRTSYLALAMAIAVALSACASSTAAGIAKRPGPSGPSGAMTALPTAAQAYRLMQQSGAAAKSVHVVGDYTDQGQKLQLDVSGDRAGQSMRLLVNFGTGVIDILMVKGDFYLKADAAFWMRLDGSAATAKMAAGKYVKVPAGSAAGMGSFRVGALLDQVFAQDIPSADKLNPTVQKTNVDGVPAYRLTAKTGDGTKVYISTDSAAHLLRTESAKNGTLDFTDWDSATTTAAPPADRQAKTPSL
jgi:hypothetical protein